MKEDRVDLLKEIVRSGRIDADLETGKIYSLVQRGRMGERVLLRGADLNGYIIHSFYFNGRKYAFRAHQVIMAFSGTLPSDGFVIDHINRNKKDNRACNLRLVDAKANYENQDRSHIGISEVQAASMHDIYMGSRISFRALARMFNCSSSRAQQVVGSYREKNKSLG